MTNIRTLYKFTDANKKTYNDTQWQIGEWAEVPRSHPGEGPLCSDAWLHAYTSTELAEFMDPIHGNFGTKGLLWEIEAEGPFLEDGGKIGSVRQRLVRQLDRTIPTPEQRVEFAIHCAAAALGVDL